MKKLALNWLSLKFLGKYSNGDIGALRLRAGSLFLENWVEEGKTSKRACVTERDERASRFTVTLARLYLFRVFSPRILEETRDCSQSIRLWGARSKYTGVSGFEKIHIMHGLNTSIDKMRGNNALETVKMKKKNKFLPFRGDYHELLFCMKLFI